MTWKPEKKMTVKQVEKELNRIAVKFEDDCMNGHITATVKFQEFTDTWFKEYAELKLKTQTIRCYHNLKKRVYGAIGHMRLDKINVRTIQKFVTQLTEEKRLTPKVR